MVYQQSYLKKSFFKVLAAGVVLTLLGCPPREDGPAEESSDEIGTAVAVFVVQRGSLVDYIKTNGDVIAENSVDIYPNTAGKVATLQVDLGDSVVKGQTVAYIDPSVPGMVYSLSPVESTITGTVTSLPVQIGDAVNMQTAVAQVGNLKKLNLETFISERFISRVTLKQEVILAFEAYPGRNFNAVISEISPVVDPLSRTIKVKADIEDPERLVKPGMYASVKIVTEVKEGVVVVPTESIFKQFGKEYAYVVLDDNRVEKREVATSLSIDSKTEVVSGIVEGEQLVTTGHSLLDDGSVVNIVRVIDPIIEE